MAISMADAYLRPGVILGPRIPLTHLLYIAAALVLIGAGLIVFPLPIPFGAPMVAVGVTLLISHSRVAARGLMALRFKSPQVERAIHFLEVRAPKAIARVLRRTRPIGARLFRKRQ
jgi:hypothetical protein